MFIFVVGRVSRDIIYLKPDAPEINAASTFVLSLHFYDI